jgi:hypothetical protein
VKNKEYSANSFVDCKSLHLLGVWLINVLHFCQEIKEERTTISPNSSLRVKY